MTTGLKSIIYPLAKLAVNQKIRDSVTADKPYFDEPYQVGFTIIGCEVRLDPNAA
jgi:hypothetical protein